jgi:hypothetical protein
MGAVNGSSLLRSSTFLPPIVSRLRRHYLEAFSLAWVDYDGTYVLINTTLERQKGRNMRANPKVTLLVIDPKDGSRWIEVRGKVVEIRCEGAEAHADELTQQFAGKRRFYGDIYPVEQKQKETRGIVTIGPIKVSLDAIFK